MELIILTISILATFIGIFLAKNLTLKIIAFSIAIIAPIWGYLSITHETSGLFYRASEMNPGQMSITGVGHSPVSIIFKIKIAGEDKVIAEGLELGKTLKSDERRIDGKLLKITLLSLDQDGFTIHLTNETNYGIDVIWIVKYNKVNDLLRRAIFEKQKVF